MRISFRTVLLTLLVAVGATYGIRTLRGYRSPEAIEKRRQIDQLELENLALQKQIEEKKTYLSNLQQNPEEYKLRIERDLKLMPPGTKAFILQEGKKPDTSPSTSK